MAVGAHQDTLLQFREDGLEARDPVTDVERLLLRVYVVELQGLDAPIVPADLAFASETVDGLLHDGPASEPRSESTLPSDVQIHDGSETIKILSPNLTQRYP